MSEAPGRRFLFEGRVRDARPGQTLLGALARGRLPLLQRSIRYHRPRGPVCGIGQCTGCLVRVSGRPNVRACRHVPAEGDRVVTENSWPSPRFDVLGAIDFLFPRGVDTLRGFRRPAWALGAYHRVIRRLAGTGTVPDPGVSEKLVQEPLRRTVEVAIVGGGVSGRAVAARLAAAGMRPLVLDRQRDAHAIPGAELRGNTTVTFLPPRVSEDAPFDLLGFEEPARGVEVRARSVVVASGGYDAALLFGGNDRPGIVTADAVFALPDRDGRPPFAHGIVVGGGARAYELLDQVGPRIDGVVAPSAIDPAVVGRASELEIPLYPRSLVLGASGRSHVHTLHLRSRGTGTAFHLSCDAVILAHRRLPTTQLFFQAGARMEWRTDPGAYYPAVSASGETTVPGLFAVGESAEARGAGAAASGERAADRILGRTVGSENPPEPAARGGPTELEGYYRELLREPRRGRWFVCPCEDVLLEEIEAANRGGYRGIEVVKRYSGVGTGLCQGRYCLPEALLLLSILENRSPAEVGYVTQRPPVLPTPLAAFAGLEEPAHASGGPG